MPAAFFSLGLFDRVSAQTTRNMEISARAERSTVSPLKEALGDAEAAQHRIIQQIGDRLAQGRPPLAALDDMLDQLETMATGVALTA